MPEEQTAKRPFQVYDEWLDQVLTQVTDRTEQKRLIKRALYDSYQNGLKAQPRRRSR